MKILLKYPSRERPDKFRDTLTRYIQTADNLFRVIVSLDTNDLHLPLYRKYIDEIKIGLGIDISVNIAPNKSKIQAINAGVSGDFDILVLGSDDMICKVQGWDEQIKNEMQENYPDLDGVLYHFDGFQPLNTMPIMGRKAYEKTGYIYHPEYISLWADNEFQEYWDLMGKQTRFNDVLFRHEAHFNDHRFNTNDRLMQRNQSYYEIDKMTFMKRKSENFGL